MQDNFGTRLENAHRELPKYLLVCSVSFSSDYLTLYCLTEFLHWHYLMSALIGFLLGNVINYLIATKLVFSRRRLNSRYSESFIYVAIGFLVLPIHHGVLWFCTETLEIIYYISKFIASGVVFLAIFGLRKFFLF